MHFFCHLNFSVEFGIHDLREAFRHFRIRCFKTHLVAAGCCTDVVQILQSFGLDNLCQPFGGLSRASGPCNVITSRRKAVFQFLNRSTFSNSSLSASFVFGVESPLWVSTSERFVCNGFLLNRTLIPNCSCSSKGCSWLSAQDFAWREAQGLTWRENTGYTRSSSFPCY